MGKNNSLDHDRRDRAESAKDEPADKLTRRNIGRVLKIENAAKARRTPSDRVADAIARFCGSMTFVWVHVIWFGGWILFNVMPGFNHIDPFPFTFLTLVVSLEAIFLSTFILISQNHDARIGEKRNHLDLQINLLAEQETTKMLALLRQIAHQVGAAGADDEDARALQDETKPEKLVDQLEEMAEDKDRLS